MRCTKYGGVWDIYIYICVCVLKLYIYIYIYDHICIFCHCYNNFHCYNYSMYNIHKCRCVCVCWYSVCEIVLDMFATILKQVRSNTLIMTGRVRPPCHSPMIVWVGGIPTLWKMMEWKSVGSWDDEIPNWMGKKNVPNHQPVLFGLTKGSLNDQ